MQSINCQIQYIVIAILLHQYAKSSPPIQFQVHAVRLAPYKVIEKATLSSNSSQTLPFYWSSLHHAFIGSTRPYSHRTQR